MLETNCAPDAFAEARARHQHSGEQVRRAVSSLSRLLVAAILIAAGIRIIAVQPVHVTSGSMHPLLEAGDFLFVAKAPYGWSSASLPAFLAGSLPATGRIAGRLPDRGDVVLFAAAAGRPGYLKRVVGLPGDRIALEAGRVRLNGTLLDCQRLSRNVCREILPAGPSYLITESGNSPLSTIAERRVPAGHVFVLGDNRDESADSRLSPEEGGAGMVPEGRLIGRAGHIFFSLGPDGPRLARIGTAVR